MISHAKPFNTRSDPHRLDDFLHLGSRQAKRIGLLSHGVIVLSKLRGEFPTDAYAFDGKGSEPATLPNKSSSCVKIFFTALTLLALLAPRAALAQGIPHHRLDFEADRGLPYCNDLGGFLAIITTLVPLTTFEAPAERKLIVRIRRAPDGAKVAEVTLSDVQGTPTAQVIKTYAPTSECFKVLFATGQLAAKMLSSLETPSPSSTPENTPNKAPDKDKPLRRRSTAFGTMVPPQEDPWREINKDPWGREAVVPKKDEPRRGFIGLGTTVGYGLTPKWAVGPRIFGGFVPTSHFPRFSIELDATWLPLWNTKPAGWTALQMHAVPFDVAGCYTPRFLRVCGFFASGIVRSVPISIQNSRQSVQVVLGAGVRVGLEPKITQQLSLRLDADAAWNFVQGDADGKYWALWRPYAFNVSFTGAVVWSFR